MLAITHYSRLLEELRPDLVHILVRGTIERPAAPSWPTSSRRPATPPFAPEQAVGLPMRAAKSAPADPFADPLA